jgi:transcriptional regulator with XRE-family HTH domain
MLIGERLRGLREEKQLSQGDIEERTGLLRCYVSRVENGHTVPAVETLEKFARALEVPIYQLLYDGEEPPRAQDSSGRNGRKDEWGSFGKSARYLHRLREFLARTSENDRELLLGLAQHVIRQRHIQKKN